MIQKLVTHITKPTYTLFNSPIAPTLHISKIAAEKMECYVGLSSDEVGWLGTILKQEEPREYLLEDVFLVKQEVTAATTELDPAGLAALAEELTSEQLSRLLFWGHSHVNMGTTPSSVDDAQMDDFTKNGCDWFFRGIMNKKGRLEIAFFDYTNAISFQDIPWYLPRNPEDDEFIAGIKAELEQKVSKSAPVVYKWIKKGGNAKNTSKVSSKRRLLQNLLPYDSFYIIADELYDIVTDQKITAFEINHIGDVIRSIDSRVVYTVDEMRPHKDQFDSAAAEVVNDQWWEEHGDDPIMRGM